MLKLKIPQVVITSARVWNHFATKKSATVGEVMIQTVKSAGFLDSLILLVPCFDFVRVTRYALDA